MGHGRDSRFWSLLKLGKFIKHRTLLLLGVGLELASALS